MKKTSGAVGQGKREKEERMAKAEHRKNEAVSGKKPQCEGED